MKFLLNLLWIALIASCFSCEKVARDAVELSVDFTWEGMQPCGWGNPEIHIRGLPAKTKFIEISMYDHAYFHDHGKVTMPYTGDDVIKRNRFEDIQGPCPPDTPGKYEITIKAIDENKVVIGKGTKTRRFPEKK